MEDFSLIILCRAQRHLLPLTLDTLKPQSGSFEILLLGSDGDEQMNELVKNYPELKIRMFPSSGQSLSQMMNEGTELAFGRYVQFLEPGDRYISHHGLAFLTDQIKSHPQLITEKGSSCWLDRQTVLQLGGFDEKLSFCPMQDLLYRFQRLGIVSIASRRVLVDSTHPPVGSIRETCKILYRHFGFWHVIKWIFIQDRSQLFERARAFFKESFKAPS